MYRDLKNTILVGGLVGMLEILRHSRLCLLTVWQISTSFRAPDMRLGRQRYDENNRRLGVLRNGYTSKPKCLRRPGSPGRRTKIESCLHHSTPVERCKSSQPRTSAPWVQFGLVSSSTVGSPRSSLHSAAATREVCLRYCKSRTAEVDLNEYLRPPTACGRSSLSHPPPLA
jgi:hypothetical protein